MKSDISICGIDVPEHLIRYSYNTTTLHITRRETVFIRRTTESEEICSAIQKTIGESPDPNKRRFSINETEWAGTVEFDYETDGSGYIVQLTVA